MWAEGKTKEHPCDAGKQVDAQEAAGAEEALELGSEHIDGIGVERQVDDPYVQEYGGHQSPDLAIYDPRVDLCAKAEQDTRIRAPSQECHRYPYQHIESNDRPRRERTVLSGLA